jgi:hypothetical protein
VENTYINKSYRVFNIGAANNITAYSCELAFPMEQNVYIEAIDAILTLAEQSREVGELYHTGPIAVRFVRAADAFLSPQFGRNTCMAEIIVVKDTAGGLDLLHRCENVTYTYEGRPHWGQVNSLTGSNGLVRRLYPKLETWLAVRNKIDPIGTFTSPFSQRTGLSQISPSRR